MADKEGMSAIDKIELRISQNILKGLDSEGKKVETSDASRKEAKATIEELREKYPKLMFKSGGMLKKPNNKGLSKLPKSVRNNMGFMQKGGMIGAADMSAKKTSAPKKKKMPQYYMGGGMIKKGKKYAYGGRVAKYKG